MHDNDNHQDDARPIPQGSYGRPRSWPEAYRAFKSDPREGRRALLFAKLCTGLFGINVVDDLIPLVGQADDPLAPLQVLGILAFGGYIAWRVNKYRNPRK